MSSTTTRRGPLRLGKASFALGLGLAAVQALLGAAFLAVVLSNLGPWSDPPGRRIAALRWVGLAFNWAALPGHAVGLVLAFVAVLRDERGPWFGLGLLVNLLGGLLVAVVLLS